ncbi:CrcB family protein [Limnobacter sp.]|uniref:fluoride efflux transporter FluC n=1 Tax=Limnobacter sp. TaxID=2003368 RepID=UPI003516D282
MAGFLAVFVGAGLGGAARHAINLWLPQPSWIPVLASTLFVNLLGGLLAGVLYAALGPAWLKTQPLGLFLMTGVLGGLTTFSAFTAEGATLLVERPALALLQAALHVLGCLAAFWLGSRLYMACAAP